MNKVKIGMNRSDDIKYEKIKKDLMFDPQKSTYGKYL
jgi:hypothetical protein